MGLARLSYQSSPRTKSTTLSVNTDARKPFDFLKLPKDIRLMVYEKLRMKTYRDRLPLRDAGHHLTLVTTVIPGISVMATCHRIRAEASPILLPWLQKILHSPPMIAIRAEHIVSLINTHDCYTSFCQKSLLERLLILLRNSRTVPRIMRYRRGGLTAKQLQTKFRLQKLIATGDETSINSLARFILRGAKYIATNPDTECRCPPLTLVLEIPDTFLTIPITTSTSLMKSFTYKCLFPMVSTPPRTVTGQADITWLVRRLTYRMAITCQLWCSVTLAVKLRYLLVERTGWGVAGKTVQRAIMLGLEKAKNKEPHVVSFSGRVTQRYHEEV